MGLVNHLKDVDAQGLFLEVAYGKHVVSGDLAKSIVTGSSPTHVIKLQHMLGRGPWDGCEGLWWSGVEVVPAKYKFHPGIQTPDPVLKTFSADNTTNTLTSTAHGFADGDIVIHPGGDLPAPLIAGNLYYVRDQATNTYKLALTSGGTAIDLTTNGTGTLQVFRNDAVQGVDTVFDTDTPHSGVAWIRAELGSGLGDFNTVGTPPVGLSGIFRTMKVQDYDSDGLPDGAIAYSTNPALQVADLILRLGGRPTSRIDWAAWTEWRDFLGELISYDYTLLPDFEGFGLTATLYNDTTFTTPISQRIDPVILFVLSAGSPGIGINVDNFGVRWEGKIKFNLTGTYTFTVAHDDSAKLWVDSLVTPIMNQPSVGTHTATFAATAGVFYDIKIEWTDSGGGNAEFKIEWETPGLPKEILPHRALYPKTVDRPRYETHPAFTAPTRLDDAVRTILNLCNSTYQEVNGKLRFFCLEQLEASSFRFTNDVISDGSLRIIPRDVLNIRNSWQVKFRDVDSQYLEEPIDPITIERPDLIEKAGRRIDGDSLELFNCTPHQAYRSLDRLVKRTCDRKFDIELSGTADTYKVLPGDPVSVDIEFRDLNAHQMLVVEAFDDSSEESPDERRFYLQEWTGQTITEP